MMVKKAVSVMPQACTVKYLSPATTKWRELRPIIPQGAEEDKVKEIEEDSTKARNAINDTLLGSLQMQNLMVVAGSGTSRGPGPSMSDLWDSILELKDSKSVTISRKEISKKIGYDDEEGNIEQFLSLCEAFFQVNNDITVANFISLCKGKILEKCSFCISDSDIVAHTTFLHRLSRRRVRDTRLKLFTTNYDLCFETAASKQGIVVLDGFSFTQPRYYDPRFFGYDIVRRPHTGEEIGNYLEGVIQLYKLHGSVNWARPSSERNFIAIKEKPTPEEACLIFPAKGKYQQSYIQPHLELIAQYLSSLREPNTCLIVTGFGFNDDHLSEPILSAVKTNPHLRLIIADCNTENCITQQSSGNHYWKELSDLSKKGEDIWFINGSFQDFTELIPDLKSLTPADMLVKSIRSLSGR